MNHRLRKKRKKIYQDLSNRTEVMKKISILMVLVLFALKSFAQAPTITSFSPMRAAVGASVTITGTNFDTTPANNVVYFAAVKGTVTACTSSSITVTVPIGATQQPLAVFS